ncbi:hypothetical protein EDD53_2746 [Pacificibacter maritimus]|uniref:Uncharacterized protein n=1 Tax=Pacificibacter maritimus TaxID=762213 RepID=A0A3N4U856_9RHOB|nr:hypothetical protein [Pacificibacter maritimus]RPE63149.1 hypothetical protein EDD53_2746 [Pacificibacter maritimus]
MSDLSLGRPSAAVPSTIRLSTSGLTFSAPDGFCIDLDSVKETADSGFVMMAGCNALRGRSTSQPKSSMVTAVFSSPMPDGQGLTAQALAAYFNTEQGRAALSRGGVSETVEISMATSEDDILVIHTKDSSPVTVRGLAAEDWRAFAMVQNRLVTLTAVPFSGISAAGLSPNDLVLQAMRKLLQENANLDV